MKAEQFIKDYTRKCSNELCAVEDKYGKEVISYHEWLTPEQALSAVAIEREEVIEKVCTFLKDRIEHDSIDYPMATMHLIDDFQKFMNEQV